MDGISAGPIQSREDHTDDGRGPIPAGDIRFPRRGHESLSDLLYRAPAHSDILEAQKHQSEGLAAPLGSLTFDGKHAPEKTLSLDAERRLAADLPGPAGKRNWIKHRHMGFQDPR
jgi:hypothetical protein